MDFKMHGATIKIVLEGSSFKYLSHVPDCRRSFSVNKSIAVLLRRPIQTSH
jgi:hypothetical protein